MCRNVIDGEEKTKICLCAELHDPNKDDIHSILHLFQRVSTCHKIKQNHYDTDSITFSRRSDVRMSGVLNAPFILGVIYSMILTFKVFSQVEQFLVLLRSFKGQMQM